MENFDKNFINISNGKPATQSSLSQWSKANDAARAINPDLKVDDFSFHTDNENSAWWEVDLLTIYEIRKVCIHNRIKTCQEKADHLIIELSIDGTLYTPLKINTGRFYHKDDCLRIFPSSVSCKARFLRIRNPQTGYLHLSKIEIFSTEKDIKISENLPLSHIGEISYKKPLKIGLMGTSNSITNGYRAALSDQYFSIIQSLSIGSSHSCFMLHQIDDLDNEMDYLIVDFFPNEERALRKSGIDFTEKTKEVIKFIQFKCHEKGVKLIVLMLPSIHCFGEAKDIYIERRKNYKNFFSDRNIFFYDAVTELEKISARFNRKAISFFKDESHLSIMYTRMIGKGFGEKILIANDSMLKSVSHEINLDYHNYYRSNISSKKNVTYSNSLFESSFLPFNEKDSYPIVPPQKTIEIVGIALNMARSNCYLNVHASTPFSKNLDNDYNDGESKFWLVCWNFYDSYDIYDGRVNLTISEKPAFPSEENDHLDKKKDAPATEKIAEICSIYFKEKISNFFNISAVQINCNLNEI